jgi:hypothetical protein
MALRGSLFRYPQNRFLRLNVSDDLKKDMMLKMANLVETEVRNPRTDSWRRDVTEKLFRAGRWTQTESLLLGAAKKAASMVPGAVTKFALGG